MRQQVPAISDLLDPLELIKNLLVKAFAVSAAAFACFS
jgi:hypothetical protein